MHVPPLTVALYVISFFTCLCELSMTISNEAILLVTSVPTGLSLAKLHHFFHTSNQRGCSVDRGTVAQVELVPLYHVLFHTLGGRE